MLGSELDLPNRRESSICNLEVTNRKLAEPQGVITNMATGLHRKTANSYISIRRGVDGTLNEISRRLKVAFDCEALSLKQTVHKAVFGAAKGTRESFTNAPVASDIKLGAIVGRAPGSGESAKPGASL